MTIGSKMKESGERGKIYNIKLKSPIVFNGSKIINAIIELDHINYGLNKKTGLLNTKKRSNFSNGDIEKFIKMLDGEDLIPERYSKDCSSFSFIIKCPVKGKFENKEFLMIFRTYFNKADEIYTVTLFPNW
jgi:hypothetical protein